MVCTISSAQAANSRIFAAIALRLSLIHILAVRLSDRHKGIGGDGIVLICPSELADAKMRMFNIDGSEGKMCGNGIRCVAKYLFDNGIARGVKTGEGRYTPVSYTHLDVYKRQQYVS